MKCDAFLQIAKMKELQNQIQHKMKDLKDDKSELCEEDFKDWLRRIKTEISDIVEENPCFQLGISTDSSIMQEASNQLCDVLSVKSTLCDPNNYEIKSSPKGEYCNILISGLKDDPFKHAKTSLLEVTIESKNHKETCTIRHLINEGKALRLGSNEIAYPVKVKNNLEFKVSVKVLRKDIVSSPIIVRKSECNENSEILDFFSRELDNQYEKQGCSTYYCRILI